MADSVLKLFAEGDALSRSDPAAIQKKQAERLKAMVAHARAHSPFYNRLYAGVPSDDLQLSQLPTTSKKLLMSNFDEWVTDRSVKLKGLQEFVEDPALIGRPYLGKYTVATTSGTTGQKGIFLLDEYTMRVVSTIGLRMMLDWVGLLGLMRIVSKLGRISQVMATGGHFASTVAGARMRSKSRLAARRVQVLSVHSPLPELVAALNSFQPAILAPYASMASLLADEQEAGRLHIRPVLLALAAEGLPEPEYARIARVFNAKVGNSYASTECPFLSYSCSEGWLHVNSDWAVLEPIDEKGRPVQPGTASHSALLTNLANRVQPILRYDIGDAVLQRPDRCPCGNPFPAIRVQGRSADTLTVRGERAKVRIPPLAFSQALASLSGLERFQVVQESQERLALRLRVVPEHDSGHTSQAALDAVRALLRDHGASNVDVQIAAEQPQLSSGGKLREVIPLAAGEPRAPAQAPR
jgi:phenylacetate-coenzyme A ligase PaaK-like adenylate-forming protein